MDETDRMRCIALALELWGPSEYPFAQNAGGYPQPSRSSHRTCLHLIGRWTYPPNGTRVLASLPKDWYHTS